MDLSYRDTAFLARRFADNAYNLQLLQSIPVHLTSDAVNSLHDNFMVIEVWNKKPASQRDEVLCGQIALPTTYPACSQCFCLIDSLQLLGYVKLPLNSFYLSYKDNRIANVLCNSQVCLTACLCTLLHHCAVLLLCTIALYHCSTQW